MAELDAEQLLTETFALYEEYISVTETTTSGILALGVEPSFYAPAPQPTQGLIIRG